MSQQQRHSLALVLFAVLMLITGFFDPVLAIDVGFFCMLVGFLISHVKRWWKEPGSTFRRILGMSTDVFLLLIIGFLIYLPVPMLCNLVSSNYSSSKAGIQLREIVIAFHNWHQDHQQFPAVASYSETGKPLLSWRVHVLPYLGYEDLYREFHLDEPWDSPHNLTLLPKIPKCYRLPWYGQQAREGGTFYQLIVGPGAVFEVDKQATLQELKERNRLASTIIAGIAQHPVPWTKPADLVFEPGKPLLLGRVVRQSPTPLGSLLFGQGNSEPGEGNRAFRLVFADGHLGSVHSRESHSKLEPFIRWQGPKPANLEDLP
jgi:hypothetical protein